MRTPQMVFTSFERKNEGLCVWNPSSFTGRRVKLCLVLSSGVVYGFVYSLCELYFR